MTGRALGVDLGATWLRAALAVDGRLTERWKRPAVRWTVLADELKLLSCGPLDRLVAGATGVWSAADRRAFARSLSGLARRVRAMPDVELAHEAAFSGGPGVLVIAGTGSIALGRDARGRFARAGGWGPLLGDEGSAFWLGREALREPRLSRVFPESLALRLAHDPEPIRAVAALAPKVLRLARKEPAARTIVRRGAAELARQARALASGLGLAAPVPLRLHGSLFKNALYRKTFLSRSGRVRLVDGGEPADVAAALRASRS